MDIKEYKPDAVERLCIEKWRQYKLTETKADFITLMINLKMHDETLEMLYEGCGFCGFVLNDTVESIVKAVLDHTAVYDNALDYIIAVSENMESGESIGTAVKNDLKNADNVFMKYQGKIYKRIYC